LLLFPQLLSKHCKIKVMQIFKFNSFYTATVFNLKFILYLTKFGQANLAFIFLTRGLHFAVNPNNSFVFIIAQFQTVQLYQHDMT